MKAIMTNTNTVRDLTNLYNAVETAVNGAIDNMKKLPKNRNEFFDMLGETPIGDTAAESVWKASCTMYSGSVPDGPCTMSGKTTLNDLTGLITEYLGFYKLSMIVANHPRFADSGIRWSALEMMGG